MSFSKIRLIGGLKSENKRGTYDFVLSVLAHYSAE